MVHHKLNIIPAFHTLLSLPSVSARHGLLDMQNLCDNVAGIFSLFTDKCPMSDPQDLQILLGTFLILLLHNILLAGS